MTDETRCNLSRMEFEGSIESQRIVWTLHWIKDNPILTTRLDILYLYYHSSQCSLFNLGYRQLNPTWQKTILPVHYSSTYYKNFQKVIQLKSWSSVLQVFRNLLYAHHNSRVKVNTWKKGFEIIHEIRRVTFTFFYVVHDLLTLHYFSLGR